MFTIESEPSELEDLLEQNQYIKFEVKNNNPINSN